MKIYKLIETALNEDFAKLDSTTNPLISKNLKSKAILTAKQEGIICGVDIARDVLKAFDKTCRFAAKIKDGQKVKKGMVFAEIYGKTRTILSCERTMLNFLQHLSGVSTLTNKYVKALGRSKTKIFDTRKTLPGYRELEKYAVRCGGGVNHRMNLNDMAMIKDNHLMEISNLREAVRLIKSNKPGIRVEVECEDIKQVMNALDARADVIMLDNMPVNLIKRCVKIIREISKGTEIELSGGINIQTIRRYANLGADRISIGALTHSAPALDISLDII